MMAAMVGMGGAPMGVSVGTWGGYGGDVGGGPNVSSWCHQWWEGLINTTPNWMPG